MATVNHYPAGTTHVLMRFDSAAPVRRVPEGWCLWSGTGSWEFFGPEIKGYKVDAITGIVWDDNKPEVSGPINHVQPGKRIPIKFSCEVAQYAYDNGHALGAFPRPGFYGRMAAHLAREVRDLKAALAARDVAPVAWRPMSSAPRDGQMLRLVVRFTEHSIEDGDLAYTIGSNNFGNDEVDEWQFAGWCWAHDHFTTGKGEPIGWLPMLIGGEK